MMDVSCVVHFLLTSKVHMVLLAFASPTNHHPLFLFSCFIPYYYSLSCPVFCIRCYAMLCLLNKSS